LALEIARERLSVLAPLDVARRAAVAYEAMNGAASTGTFRVPLLGDTYRVTFPAGEVCSLAGKAAPGITVALLVLHYLACADGHPPAEQWAAFRELPDGLVYDRALRGRVQAPLVGAFSRDPDLLGRAAAPLGGVPLAVGDAAYAFDAFPRVRLAVAVYLGDEELPSTARLLYDAAAGHYLPTEDLAILGGMLVGRLLAEARYR